MHTYFVSYSFLTVDGERRYRDTVLEFPHTVGGSKESLEIVRDALVAEVADEFYNVSDVHIISLQYQHSRPSGAPAP